MKLRTLLLGSVAGLLFAASANAQPVNTVPSVGLITGILRSNSYTASSAQLAPASSATDIACLNGSTSKNVHVHRIIISGTAGTAISPPVLINLNHSLDTSGTAATGLALPVPVPLNTLNPAATATATAYTANPTVNDSTPNLLAVVSPTFQVTTTANQPTQIYAGTAVDDFNQGWDIPKAATVVQQICVNLDGKSVSTGLLNITFDWTED